MKPGAPLPLGQRLAVPGNHHDEGGQVLVDRPQPIGDPRAQARPARELKPGLRKRHRRIVIDLLGVHRLDEAQVVDHLGGVRQQLADPGARLPVLRELEDRLRRPESSSAPRSSPSAAGRSGSSRAGRCHAVSRAPACSRTSRAATARRPGTDRSPAWPSAQSAAVRQTAGRAVRPARLRQQVELQQLRQGGRTDADAGLPRNRRRVTFSGKSRRGSMATPSSPFHSGSGSGW